MKTSVLVIMFIIGAAVLLYFISRTVAGINIPVDGV